MCRADNRFITPEDSAFSSSATFDVGGRDINDGGSDHMLLNSCQHFPVLYANGSLVKTAMYIRRRGRCDLEGSKIFEGLESRSTAPGPLKSFTA